MCAFHVYEGESSENLKSVKAEHINREKSCFTVNKGAVFVDTSHGSAHRTIHNMLQFHKVWVPRQTTPKLKIHRCQPLAFLFIQNKWRGLPKVHSMWR